MANAAPGGERGAIRAVQGGGCLRHRGTRRMRAISAALLWGAARRCAARRADSRRACARQQQPQAASELRARLKRRWMGGHKLQEHRRAVHRVERRRCRAAAREAGLAAARLAIVMTPKLPKILATAGVPYLLRLAKCGGAEAAVPCSWNEFGCAQCHATPGVNAGYPQRRCATAPAQAHPCGAPPQKRAIACMVAEVVESGAEMQRRRAGAATLPGRERRGQWALEQRLGLPQRLQRMYTRLRVGGAP